ARVERGPGHIAAITSDSRLVRGFDKHIQIIRVSDGRKLFETDQGNSYPLAISIDPTGRYVALGEFPAGAIDIWTIDGLTKKKTFRCKDQNGQEVSSDRLAFSPDGKR